MTTISLSAAKPKARRGRRFRAAAAIFFLLPLLGACAPPADIETSAAWIREAPPGAQRLAAYLVIDNNLSTAITLTGVSSDSFASVQIHRTTMHDGVARMRMIGELTIGPGQAQSLNPGGTHLMLIDPRTSLADGDTVRLVLHFADQPDLALRVPVKAAR